MDKLKTILTFKRTIVLLTIILVIIFAFQNWNYVKIKFLFFSLNLPLSLVIFFLFILGVATGWFLKNKDLRNLAREIKNKSK